MNITLHTPFSKVYDAFLSRITDDMYMELTELDTYRILEELLIASIPKFEFPRVDLDNYEIESFEDEETYQGVESDGEETKAFLYDEGYFENILTQEEINIIAVYMIVEWFGYQLASVENTRMKYSGLTIWPLYTVMYIANSRKNGNAEMPIRAEVKLQKVRHAQSIGGNNLI